MVLKPNKALTAHLTIDVFHPSLVVWNYEKLESTEENPLLLDDEASMTATRPTSLEEFVAKFLLFLVYLNSLLAAAAFSLRALATTYQAVFFFKRPITWSLERQMVL